jgi:uncharacterized phage-associated protein
MEKFSTVLHYIIDICGHKDNVGKTVLFKLLYFSDFDFYELYEEKMTGEEYKRLPYGPGPEHFSLAISKLVQEEKISSKTVEFGKDTRQFRYDSLDNPDIDLLSKEELNIIDNVINRCSHMNANKISDYSHEDLPWQATETNEIIDYELVFYRTPEFSVRKYEED